VADQQLGLPCLQYLLGHIGPCSRALLLLLLVVVVVVVVAVQVLTQVQDLRHQGLMRLLASRDQRQQQALLGLDYPQLQLVVAQGDVTAVANMIQALSDSLIR
jgi:hypothetical protein